MIKELPKGTLEYFCAKIAEGVLMQIALGSTSEVEREFDELEDIFNEGLIKGETNAT